MATMIRAIILDCDGVIVDSEPAHYEAFRRALEAVGLPLTETEYFDRFAAFDDESLFRMVFEAHERALPRALLGDLLGAKRAELGRRLADLPAIPATREFAERAVDAGYRIAVASGARRVEVETVLERAGLAGDVEFVVAAEDVRNGKPDPEPYRRALDGLNAGRNGAAIAPAECLVVEDAPIGVRAARDAGMWVVGVATSYPPSALAEAHLVLRDLAGLTVAGIEDRLAPGGGEP